MAREPQTSRLREVLHTFTNCFKMSSAPSDLQPNRPMSTSETPSPERQGDHQVNRKSIKDTGLECRICANIAPPTRTSRPCRKCKEPWCHDCIRNLFMTATQDLERMPARCDHKVMHHNVAKDIVTANELANYKLKYEEFCTPKPFYCPVPTCSTFLPPRHLKTMNQYGHVACRTCTSISCTKCRQLAEPDHKCIPNAVLSKIKALQYKLCPKCGTGVLKMYGCDHIRCHCGAHWCWACERSIDVCWNDPCAARLEDGAVPEGDSDGEDGDLGAALRTIIQPATEEYGTPDPDPDNPFNIPPIQPLAVPMPPPPRDPIPNDPAAALPTAQAATTITDDVDPGALPAELELESELKSEIILR